MKKRFWHALAFAAITISSPGVASSLSAGDYVGRWSGQTDWRGITGYDSDNSWWEFASDGTFVDNSGEAGTWTIDNDGYISFNYSGGGHSTYFGTIVGGTLLGTMTNGSANGVFALRH